jgi:hypothetical protein
VARLFPRVALAHLTFIEAQHMFFVGTAAPDGRVNVSPKGSDSLRVMDGSRIVWRNSTGSGNETAGHIRLSPRMTLMWCSFGPEPLILRAYGTARAIHRDEPEWEELNGLFPYDLAARQILDVTVDLVQTSCGFGVPLMDYRGERPDADAWVAGKGPEGLRDYWAEKNRETLDGFPTGLPVLTPE